MSKEDNAEYARAGYVRGTAETPTPSVLHLNGVVSHLAISQFLKMIFVDSFEGKEYVHYNRQKSTLLAASSVRDDQCPVCGQYGYIGDGDEDENALEALSGLKDSSAFEKCKIKTSSKRNSRKN
jgi:hypothetical protein